MYPCKFGNKVCSALICIIVSTLAVVLCYTCEIGLHVVDWVRPPLTWQVV
jgi:hypothetical protein